MKAMKKVFAIILAAAMLLGLSAAASADESAATYSITINNAADGETYKAYKIFSATANAGKTAYSYTITSTDAWFNDVLLYMGGGTTAATADTTGVYTGAGLTLTPSAADQKVYVVTAKVLGEGETAKEGTTYFSVAEFAKFLAKKTSGKTAAASAEAKKAENVTTASATLDVSTSGAGYYFVDTTLGSLCSLDTVVGTSQEIYEKNSTPTITKTVQEDDNNSTHTATATATYADSAVLDVIDTVHYQLTVNTGTNSNGSGTGVDADYTIEDVMPKGISFKDATNNAGLTVTTATGTNGAAETWTYGTDYTYTWTADTTENATASVSGTLKITLLSTGKLASLAKDTEIVIIYDAAITAANVAIGSAGNTNTAKLTYQKQTSQDTAVVKTYELVPTVTVDDTNRPAFKKVDGSTSGKSALKGVKFILSRNVGTETQYAVVDNGYLTKWGAKTEASSLTTNEEGTFNVQGLAAGTYILTETETLAGYNLLTDTITVVIAADGTVTYQYTSKIGVAGESAGTSIDVENNTGTELPSTGGIGTTIFYVIGAILVLGALILLIAKKRGKGRQE